jgi:hypothetical protein
VGFKVAEKLNRSGFVTGHGFSRADKASRMNRALAPANLSLAEFAFYSDFFRSLFSPCGESFARFTL